MGRPDTAEWLRTFLSAVGRPLRALKAAAAKLTDTSRSGKDTPHDSVPPGGSRLSHPLLVAAIDNAASGAVITDAAGAIQWVNRAFSELTGYSLVEVVGKNLRILKSATRPPELSSRRNYRKDGSVIYCEWYDSALLDASGDLLAILSLVLDVSERERAQEALQQANRRLRQLSRDLLRAQDYERRRIARELHDHTAQLLSALKLDLTRVRDSELDPRHKHQLLSEALDMTQACAREIRSLSYLLHPPLLDEGGLVDALQVYAEGFREQTGIQIDLRIASDFGRLSSDLEVALFRIVQEGLANIHQHSGSPVAAVSLEHDSREVWLVVQDQGHGLSEPLGETQKERGSARFGVGFPGMRERAEQLGGKLEITSTDVGTTLTVVLPMVEFHEEDMDPGSE